MAEGIDTSHPACPRCWVSALPALPLTSLLLCDCNTQTTVPAALTFMRSPPRQVMALMVVLGVLSVGGLTEEMFQVG